MFKLLAFVFAAAVCFLGASAKASEFGAVEADAIKKSVKYAEPISKGEIDSSIENLVKQGVISPEQAAQAREELQGLSANDIKKLQDQANQLLSN